MDNEYISDNTNSPLLSSLYRKYLANTINSAPAYSSTNSQLSAILTGHLGCVNTLNWSQTGNLLLSGSDDQCLIIHKYAYGQNESEPSFKLSQRFQTAHSRNIFDAKFNPVSEDRIVSVAGDGRVCVIDDWSSRGWDALNTRTLTASPTGHPVKRIEFIDSNVILVGCEDGTVVQFDLREEKPIRSIKLSLISQQVGIHSISKCPSAPHLFAVAGTDPFLRFYDLRLIDSNCLYTWTPPIKSNTRRSTFATGVRFSRFGYTLAANYIKDGPYVLDPVNQTDPTVCVTLKEHQIVKKADLEIEKSIWELIKSACNCDLFEQAEIYLRDLILQHKNLQNDRDWVEILAYEVFNRVLCLSRFSRGVPLGETIKEDLMMVIGVLEYWPAKYLLVMFLLVNGHIEHAEMMCEMFLKSTDESTDNKWTRKLEHVKSIMAVCQLDPAQIPKLVPKSFGQVCAEVPFVDLAESPTTQRILSSNFHGYLSHFPGVIHERTIKGISFVGDRDQYVGVGSDGGFAFIFGDTDETPVWAAKSDTSIVNVVESHPFLPVLAISGIDNTIKIWEPSFLTTSPRESTNDFRAYNSVEIPGLMKELPELQGIRRIELDFDPDALMIYLTG